jgi:hypothetical protein
VRWLNELTGARPKKPLLPSLLLVAGFSLICGPAGITAWAGTTCPSASASLMTGENGTLDISDWPLFAIDVGSSLPFLEELAANKPSHFVSALFSLAFDGRITPSGKTVSELYVPADFDSRDAMDVLSTIKSTLDRESDVGERAQYDAVWKHVLEITGGITSDSLRGCSYLHEEGSQAELIIATGRDNCLAIDRIVRDGSAFDESGLSLSRIEMTRMPEERAVIEFEGFVWAEVTSPETAPLYQIGSVDFVD